MLKLNLLSSLILFIRKILSRVRTLDNLTEGFLGTLVTQDYEFVIRIRIEARPDAVLKFKAVAKRTCMVS
jgi:hypothetical protein